MIHIRNDKDYSEIFEHIKNQVYSSDIDISSLTKIDPYQLLIIAEYALLQRKHKTESTLYCNRANRIIVNKSGLAKYISNEYTEQKHIEETIDYHVAPFAKITSSRLDEHVMKMVNYFRTFCIGKEMSMINIVIAELLNNAFDHSESLIDATSFCWYNPSHDTITIAIADLGIGIPERVNRFLKEHNKATLSSKDAVNWAIQPKATTKSSPQNRGAGINNIIDFVTANKSKLQIYSNDVRFFANSHKKALYTNPIKHFRGTIVEVDVRIKNLPTLDNDFEDFSF